MKHSNGFHYFDLSLNCDGNPSPRDIQFSLLHKEERRNPLYHDARFGGDLTPKNGVINPIKDPNYVQFVQNQIVIRVNRLIPRIARWKAYIEKANQHHLSSLTPDKAVTALQDIRHSGLSWFEQLPPGISCQHAANATQTAFCYSPGWRSENGKQVNRSTHYKPNSKPVKSAMFAKRI